MSEQTVIHVKITTKHDDIHPDLILDDIMPEPSSGIEWERVKGVVSEETVRKMLEEFISQSGEALDIYWLKQCASKYGIEL